MNNSSKNDFNHLVACTLYLFCTIAYLLINPYSKYADQIVMKNGDRLSGKITSMDPSIVTISVPYAGNFKIDRGEVSELHTDRPLRMILTDDSLLFGNISKSAEGLALI